MKTLPLLILLMSCASLDRIEQSHYTLWNETKALKVTDRKGDWILLESFANPMRTYEYKVDSIAIGDTLILDDKIKGKLTIRRLTK